MRNLQELCWGVPPETPTETRAPIAEARAHSGVPIAEARAHLGVPIAEARARSTFYCKIKGRCWCRNGQVPAAH